MSENGCQYVMYQTDVVNCYNVQCNIPSKNTSMNMATIGGRNM